MATVAPGKIFDTVPGQLPPDLVKESEDVSQLSQLAAQFLQQFDAESLTDKSIWRDLLCFEEQAKTTHGKVEISRRWHSMTQTEKPEDFHISAPPAVQRLAPGTSWVDVPFSFKIIRSKGLIAVCQGVLSYVPDAQSSWKVWHVRTWLENYEGLGHPDIFNAEGAFTKSKDEEREDTSTYKVLIVGAGQSGLSLAGRMGALNIPYLLIEKHDSIGHSWVGKYDSVRQHTIREYNVLPFDRTFEADEPNLLPARDVAAGFGRYVDKYSLNIWYSSTITECAREKSTGGWQITINKAGQVRKLHTMILSLATGGALGVPRAPAWSQKDGIFKGQIMHSSGYKNAKAWKGLKGIVIGSGTTGHDVAKDMVEAGLETVTMIQREKTAIFPIEWVVASEEPLYNRDVPTMIADRLQSTFPYKIGRELIDIHFHLAAKADKARFDALDKAGFRTDREAGMLDLIVSKFGSYYIDVGASGLVADGSIKVMSGIPIKGLAPEGIEFEDGTVTPADVVVVATGYEEDYRKQAASIVGDKLAASLPRWGSLDQSGEVHGWLGEMTHNLYMLGGAVALARWNSRFVALAIQASLHEVK